MPRDPSKSSLYLLTRMHSICSSSSAVIAYKSKMCGYIHHWQTALDQVNLIRKFQHKTCVMVRGLPRAISHSLKDCDKHFVDVELSVHRKLYLISHRLVSCMHQNILVFVLPIFCGLAAITT